MKKSLLLFLSWLILPFSLLHGQSPGIVAYSYWFNGDYSGMTTQTASGDSTADISLAVPLPPLPHGLNAFHIFFKDSELRHSSVSSSWFFNTGNVDLTGYEYWFNGDFTERTEATVTSPGFLNLDEIIDPSHLAPGLNTFHIRFKNGNNQFSSLSSHLFFNRPAIAMNGYEYWFDGQYEDRVTMEIANTALIDLTDAIEAHALQMGMHTFHIRFRNAMDQWSTVQSHPFFKLSGGVNQTQITAWEYWFDDQPELKVNLPMSAADSAEIIVPIDAVSLPVGWHRLHLRFLSDDFHSTVTTSYFYKGNSSNVDEQKIAGYRILYNGDPGTLREFVFPQPASGVVLIDPSYELPYLPLGKHMFSIDFRDLSGNFSSVFSDSIQVTNCLPYAAKPIQGIPQLCPGREEVTFTIPPITNATAYLWSLPPGAVIVSGDSTNTIVVNFSLTAQSGLISARGYNPCGEGAGSEMYLVVTHIPVVPIEGEKTVCTETQGAVYSVDPGYSYYRWTVGSGGNIVAGQGTSSVTVDWGSLPGTYSLSVLYSSAEDCSGVSTDQVTVRPVPAGSVSIPGSIVTNELTYCNEATQLITVPENGEPFTVEAGASAYLLAGVKIRLLPGFRVDSTGYLHAYITDECLYCSAIPHDLPENNIPGYSSQKELVAQGQSVSHGSLSFGVHPNPTSGDFTLEFKDKPEDSGPVQVEVYSLYGVKILAFKHQGLISSSTYSLAGFPPGLYLVKVTTGSVSGMVRLVKN